MKKKNYVKIVVQKEDEDRMKVTLQSNPYVTNAKISF